ncbi:uncharacterized protein M6D78_012906 [Vipera latastei]
MKLSFVVAALLISVLSTDAQNNIPDLPPPPPPPPPGYPGSQSYIVPTNYNPQVSDPKPQSFPGSAQVSYSSPPGNPGYSNNAYVGNPSPQYPPPPPPPWFPRDFDQRYRYEFEKLLEMFEVSIWKYYHILLSVPDNKLGGGRISSNLQLALKFLFPLSAKSVQENDTHLHITGLLLELK